MHTGEGACPLPGHRVSHSNSKLHHYSIIQIFPPSNEAYLLQTHTAHLGLVRKAWWMSCAILTVSSAVVVQ